MPIISNIILILAALAFLTICKMEFIDTMPGGDARVGHSYVIFFLGIAFSICILLLTIIIYATGGFDWVVPIVGGQGRTVLLGFLTITAGFAFMFFSTPSRLALVNTLVSPILMLVIAALLINQGLKNALPLNFVPWAIKITLGLNLAILCLGLITKLTPSSGQLNRLFNPNALDANDERMLTEIDACDMSKDGVFLYVFTDDNHHKRVRERAIAKIKTQADWQEELIRRLNNGWAEEAFTFLASNEVDDKNLFPEAIRAGILNQAEIIREGLRRWSHPSHVDASQGAWAVERLLRAVKKYEGMGVDYRPAMQELKAAFDEPIRFDKPKFSAVSLIDEWLKNH